MKFRLSLLAILIVMVIFSSCKNDSNNIPIPNVDHINTSDFNFQRFDKALEKLNPDNIRMDYKKLLNQYPYLTDLYFKRLLQYSNSNLDSFYNDVTNFLRAEEIVSLQDTVDHYFKSTRQIEKDLLQSSKYLKYYFPEKNFPNFYTLQSEFGYQTFIFPDGSKDGIGIGLDLFLGEEFDYKMVDPNNPSFSKYLTRTYNKDHIVRKSMELLVLDILGDIGGRRFVDNIIYNGKKLYILQHLQPMVSDTIIAEFSDNQLKWCESNELEIWSFFLDKEMMYATDRLKFNKYISPSPNSPGMPVEAPGQTGNYIGWQIVKAFMKRFPEKTLEDLVNFQDAQKLMEMSKYKPKR